MPKPASLSVNTADTTPHVTPQAAKKLRGSNVRAYPVRHVGRRDVLTGVPVSPDDQYYMTVRDYDATRPTGARYPIPYAINVARIDTGDGQPDASPDRTGGKAWAPAFKRYIGAVLPTEVAEERLRGVRWWESAYVVGRCYANLGKEATEMALLLDRDELSTAAIAERMQCPPDWVRHQVAKVRRLTPHYFAYGRRHHASAMQRAPHTYSVSQLPQPQEHTSPE